MADKLVLVTGGCRSGKSAYAQREALICGQRRAYVATCPVLDAEMAERIALHRQARAGQGWVTIDEPLDLASVFRREADFDVFLVDCLTLWINNVMYQAQQAGRKVTEAEIEAHCQAVLLAASAHHGAVFFVTNEVGLGIVPDNPAARRYRDLVGRANQTIAARADRVVLLVAGLPLQLKLQRQECSETVN